MKINIGKAAEELGVSRDTLRRWEASGKIVVERTAKGHRRYNLATLLRASPRKDPSKKKNIAYARAPQWLRPTPQEITRNIGD